MRVTDSRGVSLTEGLTLESVGATDAVGLNLSDLPWDRVDEALRQQWTALVRSSGLNPSLRPDWLEAAALAWGLLGSVRVAVFTRNGAVVAVIPFRLHKRRISGLPVRTLELAGNIVSYHQEIVAGEERSACLEAFVAHARRYPWDALVVGNVTIGGPTEEALRSLPSDAVGYRVVHAGEVSPYLELPRDWASFVASRRPSFRYRLRRAERDVGRLDASDMRWYREEGVCQELLSHMVAIDERSWKVQEGMNITARPQERRYYELLLPVMARAGILFANVLRLGGLPVAYSLCYAAGGQVGQMKTSYDESLAKERPGFLATVASVRRAAEEGFCEYDFLGDAMRHKWDWTDDARAHTTHLIFRRSSRGLLLGAAKRFIRLVTRSRLGRAVHSETASVRETRDE